jgi:hypothetical protein
MEPSTPADAAPLSTPPPQRGLDDLYDIGRLADRLGVEHATVRVWLSRKVPWLPAPDGRLNGGAVWRASTLDGIEARRAPGRPGPKRRIIATIRLPPTITPPPGDARPPSGTERA